MDEIDNNSTTEILDAEENSEVTVTVEPNGELTAKTSQVLDYQERSPFLDNLSLWDMTAQAEKIRKTKKVQAEEDEDNDSDCDNINVESEDINKYGSLKDIPTSDTRIHPRLSFSSHHPDGMTHVQRVL